MVLITLQCAKDLIQAIDHDGMERVNVVEKNGNCVKVYNIDNVDGFQKCFLL